MPFVFMNTARKEIADIKIAAHLQKEFFCFLTAGNLEKKQNFVAHKKKGEKRN